MENTEKRIEELFKRLDQLIEQQQVFQNEIGHIRDELRRLRNAPPTVTAPAVPEPPVPARRPVTESVTAQTIIAPSTTASTRSTSREKNAMEDFIGTNLLNKVGIAVLVLGIGLGAKYSIDHGLINPLTRIVLGYLSGGVLLAIAMRLRNSHTAFSAVLLSGGMAVLYFITYAAYSFYGLIPQVPAFILMVLFTFFTVFASLRYDVEVIAIIGLVGAYAVPILLSDGSGRVVILFSYITVINTGILFLAFHKYWKRLYYISFVLTWLTFASWYAFSLDLETHVTTSLLFSTIFFLTFYVTFLAYKLVRKEALGRWDVVCMLFNSFLYFGYGYLTIEIIKGGDQYLGLFTVWTALIHFAACMVIYKTQADIGDIFYFVAGMVLVFLTIAVPVQLEGNWVTLIWAMEAVLLFWIGRAKHFPTYERLSYPLMALAFISLFEDWTDQYPDFFYYAYQVNDTFTIFLNVHFLTSMLVASAFVIIVLLRERHPGVNVFRPDSPMNGFLNIALPLVAGFIFYVGFYKEIEAFWNNAYASSRIVLKGDDGVEYDQYNEDLFHFRGVWLLIYSALFAAAVSVLHFNRKTRFTAISAVVVNSLVLLVFVTSGLMDLTALRTSFLEQSLSQYYDREYGHILMRYLAILSMLPLLWFNHKILIEPYHQDFVRKAGNLFFHLIVLILLSSELIHWLDMVRVENTFKLSLSILWGCYALLLIVYGLSRDIRHIRLAGIVLFAVTLLKLFAYDMEDMSTILKTIVMVILGTLLLTASFIYNKYKRPT
jgi:uncharacterized membrane protein